MRSTRLWYLQPDPLGLIDGPAVYNYAAMNPGKYIDPRGESIGVAAVGFCLVPAVGQVSCAIVACVGVATIIAAYFAGDAIADLCQDGQCNAVSSKDRPRGFRPGPIGAREWAQLHGKDPDAARDAFHKGKQSTKDSHGNDAYSVNPVTGEIADQNNEVTGNMDDHYHPPKPKRRPKRR